MRIKYRIGKITESSENTWLFAECSNCGCSSLSSLKMRTKMQARKMVDEVMLKHNCVEYIKMSRAMIKQLL